MTRIEERYALTVSTRLVALDCALCGVVFAITEEFRDQRRQSGGDFYCPNGHSLSYGKSEATKLRERLQWEENRRKGADRRADAAERSLRATKGVVTRMKKRISAGVCPCCNRHFEQLQRHMEVKHPDFAHEDA